MSRLSEIPVRVEGLGGRSAAERGGPQPGVGLGGGVIAVLHELASLLERLRDEDEPGAVDLGTMPMAPADHEQLRTALGEGEVDATVTANGTSRVRETGVHGIWWIEHHDGQGRVQAEFLEVSRLPAILRTHPADVGAGLDRLRRRLGEDADDGSSAEGDDHG